MDKPRTVPAVSSAELEQFFTDGSPAYVAETSEQPCCWGHDLPGVGLVHAFDCPNRRPVVNLPGTPYVAGEMPASLRRDLQDSLLAQLMFAARNLAVANIVKDLRADGGHIFGQPLSCRECYFGATSDGVLHHATSCNTGHVLALIDELTATVTDSKEKEAAPAEEKLRAGDGIRLRGMEEQVCRKCGERGGMWGAEIYQIGQYRIDLSLMGLNQFLSQAADGAGAVLYTHHCVGTQAVRQ